MRTSIAELLWPNSSPKNAKQSLRVLLHDLRNHDVLKKWYQFGRKQLEIPVDASIWCDLLQFRAGIVDTVETETDAAVAVDVISLYRGEFLAGFDALDAFPFDSWVEQVRFSTQLQAQHLLHNLATYYDGQDTPDKALPFARQLVDIEPSWEAHQRMLMRLLARSGQAGAALSQYRLCRRLLREELQIEPDAETKALVRQIEEGAIPTVSGPHWSMPSATKLDSPFEAPSRPPRFLGRQSLRQTLQEQIKEKRGSGRFFISGFGGVGKTTAVTYLAHQWRPNFGHGVLWMDAARESVPAVAERWSGAYGYDFHSVGDEAEQLAALRRVLAQKEVLIIIDDVSAAAPVRPLLPDRGRHTVIFTGRNAGMAPLLSAELLPLSVLSPQNGRSLFVQIISEERAATDNEAVTQICQRLDNLPLALTIAGHYLVERPQRPLADFARQLADEAARLDISHADRQVRASFQVSWRALDREEQRLFALLGVFAGRSFSVEALTAVADLDPLLTAVRLDDLINLSLLQQQGDKRYRQHPLLAEFAREKLGANEAAFRRYAQYFLEFARQHQSDYAALRPDWDNLLRAVTVANEVRLWKTAVSLTAVLQPIWFRRGRYSEARRAFQTAHQSIMRLEDEKAFADNQLRWGQACMEQGEYGKARSHFLQCLSYYRELEDKSGVAAAQADLARIDLEQARYDEATQRLTESRVLREQNQDAAGVAETIFRLARVHHRQRQNKLAREIALQALSIQETADHPAGAVRTLRLLTFISIGLREYEQANAYAERALALAQSLHNKAELVASLYTISNAQRRLGRLHAARRYAEEGLQLNEQMGDRQTQARLLFQMCLIHKGFELYQPARDFAERSLALFEAIGDDFNVAGAKYQLGEIHNGLNAPEAARRFWRDALVIARRIDDHTMIQRLQVRLANQ